MTKKKDDFIDFEDNVTIDKTTGAIFAICGMAILGGVISTTLMYFKASSIPEDRKRELLSQYDNLSQKVSDDKLISSLSNDCTERFYLKEYINTKGQSRGQGCTWLHFPNHTSKTKVGAQTIQSANLSAQKHVQFQEWIRD